MSCCQVSNASHGSSLKSIWNLHKGVICLGIMRKVEVHTTFVLHFRCFMQCCSWDLEVVGNVVRRPLVPLQLVPRLKTHYLRTFLQLVWRLRIPPNRGTTVLYQRQASPPNSATKLTNYIIPQGSSRLTRFGGTRSIQNHRQPPHPIQLQRLKQRRWCVVVVVWFNSGGKCVDKAWF